MSLADHLEQAHAEALPRRRGGAPKGWEPGVKLHGDGTGTATLAVDGDVRDEGLDDLLREKFPGVNVEALKVIELRAWDQGDRTQQYVKVKVREASGHELAADHVERMVDRVVGWRPDPSVQLQWGTDRTGNVLLADWQIGKAGEAGGGTPETVDPVELAL